MAYTSNIKEKARTMRKDGTSIITIGKKLHVAKSTISLWVRGVDLPESLKQFLKENSSIGAKKGLEIMKAKRELGKLRTNQEAEAIVSKFEIKNINSLKLCAALLFWCEGTKRPLSSLCLANSDPHLIQTFLYCLRKGFNIDEKKLRALLHLHDYHNEKEQLAFWAKITKIPLNQFNRSYLKKNTAIRKREDYPGCLSIRYNDTRLARTLDAIYHAFSKKLE